MSQIIICIPIYKRIPNDYEITNLKITQALNKNIEKIFLAPLSLNTDFYKREFNNYKIIRFNNFFFRNHDNYSKLLLSENFYRKFTNVSHILICEPDAVLIKNICNIKYKNYDYIGSPSKYILPKFESFYNFNKKLFGNNKSSRLIIKLKLILNKSYKFYKFKINLSKIYYLGKFIFNFFQIKKKYSIGINGGLCIRKISKFLQICKDLKFKNKITAPEDHIFSYFSNIGKMIIPSFLILERIFSEKKTNWPVYGYHKLHFYDKTFMKYIHNKNRMYLKIF